MSILEELQRTFRVADAIDIAFVSLRPTAIHERPQGRVIRRLERHTVVHIAGTKGAWARLKKGGWVKRADLAQPERVPPPEGVGPADR